MNINAVHRTMTALPLIAMLALSGCGGGGGTSMGVDPGVPTTPVDMGISEIDISQFLTPAINQSGAPGMIAAIVDGDGVRAIGAEGIRRQGSPEEITADDLVHLGSVTKAMTSTMLATLVEDGTFTNGWSTTVAEVFPELAGSIHQDYHAVTVGQLVRMRGGLPRNPADWSAYSNDPDIVARRYNILRDNLTNAPAGAVGDFVYSNLSYVLAGAMAEQLTGKSWETLMQERLFAPLGITTGGFGPPGTPGEVDQPWGHIADQNGRLVPSQDDLNAARGPAGTVHISIEDWAKFVSLWLTDDQPPILDRHTLTQLRTPEQEGYAAGWYVTRQNWAGGTVIFHGGTHERWYAFVYVAPERGLAYLIVANASDKFAPDPFKVRDALLGVLGSFVTNEELPGGRGPQTPQDHVVQLPQPSGPSVAGLRNEDGDLTGLKVGNSAVSVDFHRIGRVRGTFQRPTVGSILQNEDVRIRHIYSNWDRARDVVSRYDHISFGAWATVAPETGGNADFDYRYESIGDGYLVALDSSRTPAAGMAMSGTATYAGQYTGFVKGHGADGAIVKTTGDVDIAADFANSFLLVEMLSTRGTAFSFSGSIQGNRFSGTTIEHLDETPLLQAAGATASMEGGFYGENASEAGGVFEVVGGRSQDPGRFVGAFGGKTTN